MTEPDLKIKTNYNPRELIPLTELTQKEQGDFEYVKDWDIFSARFFRYRGGVYDTQDCEIPTHNFFPEWAGFYSETFFSGVVFRFVPDTDFEEVIVGRYSC